MKEDLMNSDFRQIQQDEIGTVYDDWEEGDYRCLIQRGPHSLCAYVGVKKDHILYGLNHYDLDIKCHYGLSFSQKGMAEVYPEGYWWFGWDYSHLNDISTYYTFYLTQDGIAWTPKMVKAEFPKVLDSFRETTETFLAGREHDKHL